MQWVLTSEDMGLSSCALGWWPRRQARSTKGGWHPLGWVMLVITLARDMLWPHTDKRVHNHSWAPNQSLHSPSICRGTMPCKAVVSRTLCCLPSLP